MSAINILSWLNVLATRAAGGDDAPYVASGLGVPTVHRLVVEHLGPGGGSFNISKSQFQCTGVAIGPAMETLAQYSIPEEEVRQIVSHVHNVGVSTVDQTARLSSITKYPREAVARLTVATSSAGETFVSIRCIVPRAFSLDDLIARGTIEASVAYTVLYFFCYAPRVFLVVCGPAASGKSTM